MILIFPASSIFTAYRVALSTADDCWGFIRCGASRAVLEQLMRGPYSVSP
jgi:hypothetical protein